MFDFLWLNFISSVLIHSFSDNTLHKPVELFVLTFVDSEVLVCIDNRCLRAFVVYIV